MPIARRPSCRSSASRRPSSSGRYRLSPSIVARCVLRADRHGSRPSMPSAARRAIDSSVAGRDDPAVVRERAARVIAPARRAPQRRAVVAAFSAWIASPDATNDAHRRRRRPDASVRSSTRQASPPSRQAMRRDDAGLQRDEDARRRRSTAAPQGVAETATDQRTAEGSRLLRGGRRHGADGGCGSPEGPPWSGRSRSPRRPAAIGECDDDASASVRRSLVRGRWHALIIRCLTRASVSLQRRTRGAAPDRSRSPSESSDHRRPRFRLAVHAADCAPPARAVGLLARFCRSTRRWRRSRGGSPSGIILSGGPKSVSEAGAPHCDAGASSTPACRCSASATACS